MKNFFKNRYGLGIIINKTISRIEQEDKIRLCYFKVLSGAAMSTVMVGLSIVIVVIGPV